MSKNMKEMKFIVSSKEEDTAVQTALIDLGYKWPSHDYTTYYPSTNYPCHRYADKDGFITWGDDPSYFGAQRHEHYMLKGTELVPFERTPPIAPFMAPPIGLVPRVIVVRERLTDVLSAIGRYNKEGLKFPTAWTDELFDLLREIEDTTASL